MVLLVVLQNAYRKSGAPYRNRRQWLKCLWLSHTGKRLRRMLPADIEPYVINANPQIGKHAGAVFPPDLEHLRQTIERVNPSVILACGRMAQTGLDALGVTYVAAPHPAWRQLTELEITVIREKLDEHLHLA